MEIEYRRHVAPFHKLSHGGFCAKPSACSWTRWTDGLEASFGRVAFIGVELAKHRANTSSERVDNSAEECSKGFGAGHPVVKMSALRSGSACC